MEKKDLQIGHLWTHNNYRGKNIAKYVTQKILQSTPNQPYWFLTKRNNIPSISVAESNGFAKQGFGYRGIYVYKIKSPC